MEQKLKAAMEARRNPDFVIIGRTDAYGAEGLDAALKRAERFLRLGADGIFVAGLKTPEDYVRVGKAFQRHLELRRDLRGGGDAVAYAGRASPYGIFADRLSEHPDRARGEGHEAGLKRLGQLAAGKDDAFKNGEQEMALNSLADALDLQKWNALEKKYLTYHGVAAGRSRARTVFTLAASTTSRNVTDMIKSMLYRLIAFINR